MYYHVGGEQEFDSSTFDGAASSPFSGWTLGRCGGPTQKIYVVGVENSADLGESMRLQKPGATQVSLDDHPTWRLLTAMASPVPPIEAPVNGVRSSNSSQGAHGSSATFVELARHCLRVNRQKVAASWCHVGGVSIIDARGRITNDLGLVVGLQVKECIHTQLFWPTGFTEQLASRVFSVVGRGNFGRQGIVKS